MTSTISALTTGGGGIVMSGDSSGNLSLLSGATTVVAVTSAGAAVTGTLSATGASTFTGTGKFATTIGVGNATPSASGSGITFPATQSASSDANTLDDYEEGTWTPSVGGTATYTGRWGTYTKVGNLVTIMFNIGVNVLGTGSTTFISGLPFAINNPTYANDQSGCLSFFSNIATSVYCLNLRGTQGSTTLFFSGTTATTTSINNSVTVFGNNTSIQAAITYQTTA
ncbi:MAG: hypothetical protein F2774_08185 [Actinobacteria bacterium]|nr:hypothetical protein [Actinomycetota bacterium]